MVAMAGRDGQRRGRRNVRGGRRKSDGPCHHPGPVPSHPSVESSHPEDPRIADLLRRAGAGDRSAAGELFELFRGRLSRMVELRLDARLHGRLSASDVIQEAYLEALRRLPDYLEKPSMPFFLWLRFIAGQKLLALHEHHLGVKMRDPRREVSLDVGATATPNSETLAARLVGSLSTPSEAAMRAERKNRLREALERMDPIDREVLALRHFEHLTSAEAARVLGITESAARQRHLRAAIRLKEILKGMPGGRDEGWN
jgi:RNA polymerase sigma-70 factor, ECF subfamily